MCKSLASFSLCCMCILFSSVRGQVLGPELIGKRVSIGFAADMYKRKLAPNYRDGCLWGIPSIYVATAVSNRVSICAKGFIMHLKDRDHPVRDYYGYVVGAGIAGQLLEMGQYAIVGAIQYSNTFWYDRSVERYHVNPRSLMGAIEIERTFTMYSHEFTILLGPAYVYDEILRYPYGRQSAIYEKPSNNVGGVIGVSIIEWKYILVTLSAIYADYLQPRCSIGVLL